jgi:hypothetical protein
MRSLGINVFPFLTAHVWNEAIVRKDPDPDRSDFQYGMYIRIVKRARIADSGIFLLEY